MPEAKSVKLRPKRTREEIMKQFLELKRRHEIETGTETDQPEPKRQQQAPRQEEEGKPRIAHEVKDLLYSSEDDIMSLVRTLTVEVTQDSTVPEKGTPNSACYDITTQKNEVIPAHGIAMVPLNLKMQIPTGFFMLLLSRSGLATKGITTIAGVVDSDYRGPVYAILANSADKDFSLKKGQRCTQGLFLPTQYAEFKKVDKLQETQRNDAGFGSTDAEVKKCWDLSNEVQ